jgi:putative redox protein
MGKKLAQLDLVPGSKTGLAFRARTDGGLEYLLDSGAGAVAPSPIDVLIAAVGGCTGMDVISILRKKRLDVTGYRIELDGERRDEHPRAFTSIAIVHTVRGRGIPPAAVEEAVHLSESKYCSVHATLAPGVALSSRVVVEEEPAVAP